MTERSLRPAPLWGPVLFLLLWLVPVGVPACSIEDFVPAQFTDRCRRLLQNLETGFMAARMGSPSATEYLDRLTTEWVDFHLDHGSFPPPLFAGVATEVWASASWRIGRAVAAVNRDQWPTEEIEIARLLLLQMAEPSRIEKSRSLLASWTVALLRDPGGRVEAFDGWMEDACRHPLSELVNITGSRFPALTARTERLLRLQDDDLRLLRQSLPNLQVEVMRSLVTRWRQMLIAEMSVWKEYLLW